ncbi:capsular polysaccharide biosynthesis protein [Neotabrizicola shimadae]|uniref:Capsular polysaccharide biosynthesis protein n=1 Tax=Neotabrizicola shimadae TaxID=2807096 RepID=A0A8G0ZYP6_9RHOB|nr:capsular polysaccharide biosynthesis protein [Neotabrizicola shimadae]QYZ70644.1 capsular polysaccharide biosynthesis protein [Neotabrizicola shimadae]
MAPQPDPKPAAGEGIPRRLRFLNLGFLRQARLRRILELAGHDLRLGLPAPGDGVVVWGRSPYAARGERAAAARDAPLVRIEDAFLRSVKPGRSGAPPLGLMLDPVGVHFDSAAPSRLEQLLARHPLDETPLLARARDGIARLRAAQLSKYNLHDPALPPPAPGYVLVVDQTRGDASIRHGAASEATFREMLARALDDHPGARIVIRAHPETTAGHRPGHFGPADAQGRVSLLTDPVSPWSLLDGAIAVYTATSQLGFEAILAGHRPRVFGQPFYAGWGLTADEQPLPRRGRRLTPVQLFAAAMILSPVWYDPCRDRLCNFEEAVDQLEAETRAFREDRHGHVAMGMRLWKRSTLQQVFGRERRLVFDDKPWSALARAQKDGRGLLVWAGKEPPGLTGPMPIRRVEDGFLRSRGLGAELVPPLSLVADDLGIYYDPSRESRLERLVAVPLPEHARLRAARLRARLVGAGVTKYNLGPGRFDLPEGHRILVPGQVEDDASIRLGAGTVRSNLDLLRAVRAANPEAVILWRPHPDVLAGLRPGTVAESDLAGLADATVAGGSPADLLAQVQEVWTITSTLGFEALLRGVTVTCLGLPFYAGWGLTREVMPAPLRRLAVRGVDLDRMTHAALIAYPRYTDPVSGLPCPPEVALERLATGAIPRPGAGLRILSKLQGVMASRAQLWR